MALNFPSSPSTNDTYTFGGRVWLYNGSAWQLQGVRSGSSNNRSYTGDNSTTGFEISSGLSATDVIVTIDGSVQQPGTDYTVSGTTLTFTSAPAGSTSINILELSTGGVAASGTADPTIHPFMLAGM